MKKKLPYIIGTLIGGAITPWAISAAALQRGQAGRIGGEYLIIPLLWLLVAMGKTLIGIAAEYINNRD